MTKDAPQNQETLSVLQTVYSHPLEKRDFGELLHTLDEAILSLTRTDFEANEIPERLPSLESLDQHFELATRIDFELFEEDELREIKQLCQGSSSCFVVSNQLRILDISKTGLEKLGPLNNQPLEKLPIRNDDVRALRSALLEITKSNETRQRDRVLFVKYLEDDQVAIFRTSHFRKSQTVVISFDHLVWNEVVENAVKRNFLLTQAECKVVRLLVAGKRPSEIATSLERSVETIRSHVKAAISKTHTRDMSALIRLMCEVMNISANLDLSEDTQKAQKFEAPSAVQITCSGHVYDVTRMVGTSKHDQANTALFIHGMLQGPFLTAHLKRLLYENHIELVCPSRPGYGGTPPAATKDKFIQTSLDNMLHLMDALEIEKTVLVAHMVGMQFATRLAAHAPDRVQSIVSISGVIPMVSKVQLTQQSKMHRMAMLAAKYSPATLGYIAQIGERYLRSGNEIKCLNQLFSRSPEDRLALKNSECEAILKHGFQHLIASGSPAFTHDCQSGIEDWADAFSNIGCPVTILHGEQDSAVPSGSVQSLQPEYNNWTFSFLKNAGQTLLHTHPREVSQTLKVALDK